MRPTLAPAGAVVSDRRHSRPVILIGVAREDWGYPFPVAARRVAVTLVAILALTACGHERRLTRPEFIRAWNDICARDEVPIRDLNSRVPGEVTAATLPAYAQLFGEAARLFRMEIDHLSAVRPPKEDEPTVSAILTYLEAARLKLSRLHDAAAAGQLEPVRTSGRNESLLEARMLAQQYGVDQSCFGGGAA